MESQTSDYTHAVRFVDRDMFMRYRGGGIGHKYMRVIEELFENMSRERIHHKVRGGASLPMDTTAAVDSDEECEPTGPPQTRAEAGEEGGGADGDDSDDSDDSDFEYVDPGSDLSSEDSDSDDLDSGDEDYESYGFGDL